MCTVFMVKSVPCTAFTPAEIDDGLDDFQEN